MIEIVEVHTQAQLRQCLQIRMQVFVYEQQVPASEELDQFDLAQSTIHLLACEDGETLGTLRILPDVPGRVHIGRVAVSARSRRKGVGSKLMQRAHEIASKRFADDTGKIVIEISAQVQAIPFYQQLGYQIVNDETYLDAGIWHKNLSWCGEKCGKRHREK